MFPCDTPKERHVLEGNKVKAILRAEGAKVALEVRGRARSASRVACPQTHPKRALHIRVERNVCGTAVPGFVSYRNTSFLVSSRKPAAVSLTLWAVTL